MDVMRQETPIRNGDHALAVICLSAIVVSSAFAQSTKPAPKYDWSTPLAASASLERAIDDHDQATVTSAYHATNDDERRLLSVLDEGGIAVAELNKACVDRFMRGLPRPKYDTTRDEAEINGDEAIEYPGGKQSGLRIRWVRIKGEWKLPMAHVVRMHLIGHKTLEEAIKDKQDWTKQLRRIADEVRAGRYSSPEDVHKRLGDLAEAEYAASTQPAKK
jgi:hypothetical protein